MSLRPWYCPRCKRQIKGTTRFQAHLDSPKNLLCLDLLGQDPQKWPATAEDYEANQAVLLAEALNEEPVERLEPTQPRQEEAVDDEANVLGAGPPILPNGDEEGEDGADVWVDPDEDWEEVPVIDAYPDDLDSLLDDDDPMAFPSGDAYPDSDEVYPDSDDEEANMGAFFANQDAEAAAVAAEEANSSHDQPASALTKDGCTDNFCQMWRP